MVEFIFSARHPTSFLSLFSSQRGKEEQRKEALQLVASNDPAPLDDPHADGNTADSYSLRI